MDLLGFAKYRNKYIKMPNGCWEHTYSRRSQQDGYGRIRFKGRRFLMHRFFYALYNGEVDDHLLVCHRCNNPVCVNPSHLYLGTQYDNMQDRVKAGNYKEGHKTHCKFGHEFTETNTWMRKQGKYIKRVCRECVRIRKMEYYGRRNA